MSATPDLHESEQTDVRDDVTEPPMYRVLIHNDDFTTKAFVVEVLMVIFGKSMDDANRIMWQAHQNGTGLCGVYPLELAETKVRMVTDAARENGFPLKLSIEED
jgi:ATP-dependent Clp protease adaptor protein ClpS